MYPQSKIMDFLFGKPQRGISSNGQCAYNCPNCEIKNPNKFKLEINFKLEKFNCWVCHNFCGDTFFLLQKYANQNQIREYLSLSKEASFFYESNLSQKFKNRFVILPEKTNDVFENNDAMLYLKSRKFSDEVIKHYKLKYCKDEKSPFYNRIILPSYNKNNKLNFYTARTIEQNIKDKPKYLNCFYYDQISGEKISALSFDESLIFNENNLNFDKSLFVVEGFFDAMSLYPLTNVVYLNGKEMPKHLMEKIVEHKTNVYLMLDSDAIKNSNKIYEKLKYLTNIFEISLPPKIKDWSEFLEIENMGKIMEYLKLKISL